MKLSLLCVYSFLFIFNDSRTSYLAMLQLCDVRLNTCECVWEFGEPEKLKHTRKGKLCEVEGQTNLLKLWQSLFHNHSLTRTSLKCGDVESQHHIQKLLNMFLGDLFYVSKTTNTPYPFKI